jgi:hypothetical protein
MWNAYLVQSSFLDVGRTSAVVSGLYTPVTHGLKYVMELCSPRKVCCALRMHFLVLIRGQMSQC